MNKRITLVILAVCMLIGITACKKKGNNDSGGSGQIQHEPSNLLGFVVSDDGKITTFEAMHSFIKSAEDIGMNAKLYRYQKDSELTSCVDSAIADNCDAVLFYGSANNHSEIQKLEAQGIKTVNLASKSENASCSIVFDKSDIQILEVLAERVGEKEILIFSSAARDISSLQSALADNGYKAKLKSYVRSSPYDENAQEELESYLETHSSVKGIFVPESDNLSLTLRAADRDMIVIGCELTEKSKEQFDKGLYGVAVSPYYDMTAIAVRVMEKLKDGVDCSDEYCTYHMVTADKMDKYITIRENVQKWFNLQG